MSSASLESNIRKYYAFHFFLNLQLWFPIWIIYLTQKRGLTLGQVTLIDVPFWLCIVLLQIPSAAVADRWGRRPTLIAAALTFGAAVIFFGLASSFPLLLGCYLVWGMSFALLYGTESAFIFDTLKALGREHEYSRIYGRGWGVATGAGLTATIIGAPLADATSLAFPIILSGGIAWCAAIVAFSFREPLPPSERHSAVSYTGILKDSATIVRTNAPVRYAILFFGVITVGSIAPVFFFQPFLVQHDVALGSVGVWQVPMRLAGVLAALGAHRLMLSMGERKVFYLMPLSMIASFALLATWDSVYAQVAFPVMNFSAILAQPTVTDYLNRRVASEQRATIVSLTNLIRSATLIPAAPLMGALAQQSLRSGFLAGGIITAALALPLLLAWGPHFNHGAIREPEVAPVPGIAGGD